MISTPSLILASGSPRRQELLAYYDIPFTTVVPMVEEVVLATPALTAQTNAFLKGEAVFTTHPRHYVLSADTLVAIDDTILGKPVDAQDAHRMLRMLSAKTHQVYTGVALFCPDQAPLQAIATTEVTFLPLSDAMIEHYIQTGEPMDKAGAYGMQSIGNKLVERINGSPSNVIGLPLSVLTTFFQQLHWL